MWSPRAKFCALALGRAATRKVPPRLLARVVLVALEETVGRGSQRVARARENASDLALPREGLRQGTSASPVTLRARLCGSFRQFGR